MDTKDREQNTRAPKRKIDSVESKKQDFKNYTQGIYKVFVVPDTSPKEMKWRYIEFLSHTIPNTAEEIKFYKMTEEAIGIEKFKKTETILEQAREDWKHLKISSRAFLVNRMIDSNFETSQCCLFENPCQCKQRPNRFCCKNHQSMCRDIHNGIKQFDYISTKKGQYITMKYPVPTRLIRRKIKLLKI